MDIGRCSDEWDSASATSEFHATNAGRIIDDFLARISRSSGGGVES